MSAAPACLGRWGHCGDKCTDCAYYVPCASVAILDAEAEYEEQETQEIGRGEWVTR